MVSNQDCKSPHFQHHLFFRVSSYHLPFVTPIFGLTILWLFFPYSAHSHSLPDLITSYLSWSTCVPPFIGVWYRSAVASFLSDCAVLISRKKSVSQSWLAWIVYQTLDLILSCTFILNLKLWNPEGVPSLILTLICYLTCLLDFGL